METILSVTQIKHHEVAVNYRMGEENRRIVMSGNSPAEASKIYSWLKSLGSSSRQERRIEMKIHHASGLLALTAFFAMKTGSLKREYLHLLRRPLGNSSTSSARLFVLLLNGSLRAKFSTMKLHALHFLKLNSISGIQSEALTAAESLANMNEEFIAKIEATPLVIGVHSVKTAIEKNEYRLKLKALHDLGRI